MNSPTPINPMTSKELQEAADARAKRRAEFARLVRDAGMDPSQIDVTKIMNDEEQAAVVAHLASLREAKELAADLGRDGLRARLNQAFKKKT